MKMVKQNAGKGKHIFCAIDLHDQKMLAGIAVDLGEVKFFHFNTREDEGVLDLIMKLHEVRKGHSFDKVWVCYEASGSGFRLADILEGEGFEASVLAPTHIPQDCKSRSNKTDRNDVKRLMDVLRGHVLAGGKLPKVWLPSRGLREDREIVRRRLQLADDLTRTKNRIHGLLKRNGIRKPDYIETNWTDRHRLWLSEEAGKELGNGGGDMLSGLLREFDFYLVELDFLEKKVLELSRSSDYSRQVDAITSLKGVGVLTAMVFLTELGDLSRFPNRRALASYLGLSPRSYESGEHDDRKGHISKLGPSRVRKVLNQVSWFVVKYEPDWGDWFYYRTHGGGRILRRKMITAVMRRLGIWMWHTALEASA
jgi:transposase